MNKLALNNLNRVATYCIGLMAFLLLASQSFCQTNSAKFGKISSRFLLIVETSRPMGHRSDATLKAVTSLLYSGFNHQIKQGDTLGVWTYNQQLYTGRAPLQHWSTPLQREIVSGTLDFFKNQKYEKQPAFSSVRPALDKVIKDSEFITVVLISSGEDAMTGTPFDDKINQFYKSWKVDQEKARMPFITVLRAKRGTITGYTAIPVPWQVEIPSWPAESPVANSVGNTQAPPKIQPSSVPPLIVTGGKPKSAATQIAAEPIPSTSDLAPTARPLNAVTTAPVERPQLTTSQSDTHSPVTRLTASPPPAVPEAKVEKSEPPAHATTTPAALEKPAASSTPITKAEAASSAKIDSTNISTASTRVESSERSAPVSPDLSSALAAPAAGSVANRMIWIAAVGVIGIACAVFISFARRPRPQHISLITRSLERERHD